MKPTMHKTARADEQRRGWLKAAAAAAISSVGAGLAGCGGGSDAGASNSALPAAASDSAPVKILGVDSGGTGRSGNFFSAAVSAVAPLVAAGVQFGTGSSKVADADGQALDVSALAPGMSAQIQSRKVVASNGTAQAEAQSIRVAEQLLGAVTAVDAATSSFTVLGQRVVFKASTVFAAGPAASAADLQPGAVVRVWGELDTAGARVVATRVDLPPAGAAFVLRGAVSFIDRSNGLVAIGGYALGPVPAANLPDGLAVGMLVRARLQPQAASQAPSQLLSLRTDALVLPDRVAAEIEGRISAFDSPLHFWVDGVRVDASGATLTPGASALVVGAKVEVHGLGSGGDLMAGSVVVDSEEADAVAEIEGSIASVDATTRSFVLRGVTVVWTDATVFIGGSSALLARRRQANVKGTLSADRLRLLAKTIHVEA
jgi:hypothetical protein